MIIAIKENNVYSSTNWHEWIGDGQILIQPPYNYQLIEVEDEYSDCIYSDFTLVDGVYIFSKEKYTSRKQSDLIRMREIERKQLHAQTSNDTLQALRKLRENDDSYDWATWLDKLDKYNKDIEDTQFQEAYPEDVEYPQYPIR